MKMISSTSITSMNGVTLISWASAMSSSPRERPRNPEPNPVPGRAPNRAPIGLLRGSRRPQAAAVALAADQQQHLRRGVAEQRAISPDRPGQMIVDHDRGNRGDQAQRG